MNEMLFTDKKRKGIRFLAKIRLITINQFAKASNLSARHAGTFLHEQKLRGFLGQAGGVPLGGAGRAPKLYYLTSKGWTHYTDIEGLSLDPFSNARPHSAWTQTMAHRVQTVSLYQALQLTLIEAGGTIANERFDFRTGEYLGKRCRETADYCTFDIDDRSRIIPDAALHLRRPDGRQALAFLECDMGTETISLQLAAKLRKYCAYYRSGRFVQRYSDWGRYDSFLVLLVTTTAARINAICRHRFEEPEGLCRLFLLASQDDALSQPLGQIWRRLSGGADDPLSLLGQN